MVWVATLNKVTRVLDDGQDLESITIDFNLSAVKPLHAKWVMEAYHITSSIDKNICLKSWKKNGIQDALENGLEDDLDPFKDIDLIEAADEVTQNLDDDGSYSEDDDGNIFNVFVKDD